MIAHLTGLPHHAEEFNALAALIAIAHTGFWLVLAHINKHRNERKEIFMPCFTARTVSVDLGKANAETMLAALQDMKVSPTLNGSVISFGFNEWINVSTGQSQLARSRNVAEIKQAYSNQIVKRTAARYGWQVKVTGQNKLQLIKGR